MSLQTQECREVACVVVAVGEVAFRALGAIPRNGFWRSVAVGDGAALAAADESITPLHGEPPDDWHARALRGLESAWTGVGFVCVVHDERNLEEHLLAARIIVAGQRPERVAISVLLGDPLPAAVGPRGDLLLRLSPGTSATEGGRADALRTVLGPFESCWMPQALELVADAMRELGEACVFATRTREATSAGHALSMLLEDSTPPGSIIHMTLAPGVDVGFGELTAALERLRDFQPSVTSSIDETFPSREILVGALVATARDDRP